MYDLNLPTSDLTPYLRRGRQERAEAAARLLRGGTSALWRAAIKATRAATSAIAAVSAARARRRLRRATIRDLRSLSDRTLRDIGVPRSAIWSIADDLVAGATIREPLPRCLPVTADPRQWQDAVPEAVVRLPANRNQRSGRIVATQALAGCG